MFRKNLRRSPVIVSTAIALSLFAASCGSDDSSSDSTTAETTAESTAATTAGTDMAAASGDTCVDGGTVEIGLLNSTSGVMAISEQTVRDALLMGVEEINAAGGILGKQVDVVEEDGQSEPTIFAEKINKL